MFQQTIVIGGGATVPVFTMGADNPGVTVKNTGTGNVYLGYTPSSGVSGYGLAPGSSVVWDAGKPLYLGASVAGQVYVSANTGNLFDADAVGASLIRQGLAQDIADAVAIGGIPTIDDFTVLLSGNIMVPGGGSYQSAILPAARFQSLRVVVNETSAVSKSDVRPLRVTWYNASGTAFVTRAFYYSASGTTVILNLPVHGPSVSFNIQGYGSNGSGTIAVYGSYNAAPLPLYQQKTCLGVAGIGNTGFSYDGDTLDAMTRVVTSGTSGEAHLGGRSGRLRIAVRSTNTVGITLWINSGTAPLGGFPMVAKLAHPAGEQFTEREIIAPCAPIDFDWTCGNSTASVITFNWDD